MKLNMNEKEIEEFTNEILSFFEERMKYHFKKQYDMNLINAVVNLKNNSDIVEVERILEDLSAFMLTEKGDKLLSLYKRVSNILGQEIHEGEVIVSKFVSDIEKNLYSKLQEIELKISQSKETNEYYNCFELLIELEEPLSNLFDNLLIKDDNPGIAENRKALLHRIKNLFNSIANFELL